MDTIRHTYETTESWHPEELACKRWYDCLTYQSKLAIDSFIYNKRKTFKFMHFNVHSAWQLFAHTIK